MALRTNDVRMTLEAGKVDLKEISTNIPSNQSANKFVNMQTNQSASAHQKLASLKPSAFQKNQWSSMMRFTAPMRAGPAPQMHLDSIDSVLKAKLPVVDIKGNAESLRVVENF